MSALLTPAAADAYELVERTRTQLRFCDDGCRASWHADGRAGVLRLSHSHAGECVYCGHYVPTNVERRLQG